MDDEFLGRGHAWLNVSNLSCHAQLLREKERSLQIWMDPVQQQAAVNKVRLQPLVVRLQPFGPVQQQAAVNKVQELVRMVRNSRLQSTRYWTATADLLTATAHCPTAGCSQQGIGGARRCPYTKQPAGELGVVLQYLVCGRWLLGCCMDSSAPEELVYGQLVGMDSWLDIWTVGEVSCISWYSGQVSCISGYSGQVSSPLYPLIYPLVSCIRYHVSVGSVGTPTVSVGMDSWLDIWTVGWLVYDSSALSSPATKP